MHEFDSYAAKYKEILDQSLAFSGCTSEHFAEYKARYIARVAGLGEGCKVLDFGCGVGILSGLLHKHLPSATLHGFDVSPESIREIDVALLACGFFTTNIAQLDCDYDLIILSNVLHHIQPTYRQATIFELRKRLSPSGRLVIFEHNPVNPVTRWVVRQCPFDKGAVLLPLSETRSYLMCAGLCVVQQDYIIFSPRCTGWFYRFERFLARCPLGAQYVLVARNSNE